MVNLNGSVVCCNGCLLAYTAYTTYNSAKSGDYVTAIISITPAGKVEKVAKIAKSATNLHKHHLLPVKYKDKFKEKGLNIEDYKISLPVDKHILKPNGIHTKLGGNWNGEWKKFFEKNPNPTKEDILNHMNTLRKDFGI
jgi:hypothetical protein